MINSDTTANFACQAFVREQGIVLEQKPTSATLILIDGMPSAVTHETKLCRLEVEAYSENIVFDMAPISTYNVILGMPWLRTHVPIIHWDSRCLILL